MVRIYEEPIFDVVGLEIIRGDWVQIAKNLQQKVIKMILAGVDVKGVKAKVDEYKSVVFNQELKTEEIAVSQRIKCEINGNEFAVDKNGSPIYNKDGNRRKRAVPQHVKIARQMIANGEDVVFGQLIEYIYDEEAGCVPLTQYSGRYDANLYWTQKIFPPTYRILCSVFQNIDWKDMYLRKRKKKDEDQQDLEFFFKNK